MACSVETYLNSSLNLVKDLKKLNLPPNVRFFTLDATALYTHIYTEAAINEIKEYITKSQQKFPYLAVTLLIKARKGI